MKFLIKFRKKINFYPVLGEWVESENFQVWKIQKFNVEFESEEKIFKFQNSSFSNFVSRTFFPILFGSLSNRTNTAKYYHRFDPFTKPD